MKLNYRYHQTESIKNDLEQIEINRQLLDLLPRNPLYVAYGAQ